MAGMHSLEEIILYAAGILFLTEIIIIRSLLGGLFRFVHFVFVVFSKSIGTIGGTDNFCMLDCRLAGLVYFTLLICSLSWYTRRASNFRIQKVVDRIGIFFSGKQ